MNKKDLKLIGVAVVIGLIVSFLIKIISRLLG